MAELVKYIACCLVDHPDLVEVREVPGDQALILELRVAPEDMGKVIGKQGRIAKAIRAVVKAASLKTGQNVLVEIVCRRSAKKRRLRRTCRRCGWKRKGRSFRPFAHPRRKPGRERGERSPRRMPPFSRWKQGGSS